MSPLSIDRLRRCSGNPKALQVLFCFVVRAEKAAEIEPKLHLQLMVVCCVPNELSPSLLKVFLFKGAQSRYFELFWPHTKLPLNVRKPENNSLIR